MLTSLGGGLLGVFGRRFLITAWLPSLLYWAGFGALAATGTGWRQTTGWWLRQPAEFKVFFAVSGTAVVAAALLPWYAALACFAGGVLISWLGYDLSTSAVLYLLGRLA